MRICQSPAPQKLCLALAGPNSLDSSQTACLNADTREAAAVLLTERRIQ